MTEKRKYPIAGTDFFTQIMDEHGLAFCRRWVEIAMKGELGE